VPHAQSLTDASAMSPMSPGGLVQPAAAPLNGVNDGNFSGAHAGQPLFHGTGAAIPSFPAAETFPGSVAQQSAPDV
jgi:ATP-dependent RNA helicase DDX5/DBP2